jgi:hypothetical protein
VKKQAPIGSVLLLTLIGGAAVQASAPDTPIPHGTFQQVGDMTTPRVNPAATLLNDGTVLVTGGWERDPAGTNLVSQATAERFDPKTSTFSAAGSMAYPRSKDDAVRLQDGRVLVVGGSNDNIPATDPLYVGPRVATAELYDPATGTFSPTGDLLEPRASVPGHAPAGWAGSGDGGLHSGRPRWHRDHTE